MAGLKSLLEMPFSGRQRRLVASRPRISEADFVQRASSTDVGRDAASILWSKLNEIKVNEDLTPYPEDELLRVYGLADEDLDDDIILAIIKQLGVAVPDQEMLQKFGAVKTPHDIVRLIEQCAV